MNICTNAELYCPGGAKLVVKRDVMYLGGLVSCDGRNAPRVSRNSSCRNLLPKCSFIFGSGDKQCQAHRRYHRNIALVRCDHNQNTSLVAIAMLYRARFK